MKKTITFLFLFASFLVKAQQEETSQSLKLGIKGGLNLAVINNTANIGASIKNDFHLGLFSEFRKNKIAFQPELVYSRQGCNTDYAFYIYYAAGNTKINLSYLNVPLLLKIYAGKGFNFQLGIQPGFLLAAKEKGEVTNHSSGTAVAPPTVTIDKDVKENYKNFELAVPVGLGYNFSSKFSANIRYNYGLTDINNDPEIKAYRERIGIGNKNLTNRVIQVSIGYSL